MDKKFQYTIFKLIGFLGFATAITGIVFFVNGFGDFDHSYFILGALLMTFGIFIGALFTILGFSPQLRRFAMNRAAMLQKKNMELIKEMTDTSLNISKEIYNNTAKQIYCKHCGAQIDTDSKFCKNCGGAQ